MALLCRAVFHFSSPCGRGRNLNHPLPFTRLWENETKTGYSYSFYIPGLDFRLVVGKESPPTLQKMSAFASPQRYRYASEAGATEMMQFFGKIVGSSQVVGKPGREFPTKK